jgi:hypothetical protein
MGSMTDVDLHFGYDPEVTKARILAALQRARNGDPAGESHVTFESCAGLARILDEPRRNQTDGS